MKTYIALVLKGIGMGAANVVPGVSGGTIALITGIFERLINAIKSFDIQAVRLLFSGRWKAFAKHTDLAFLIAIFAGVAIAILSIARLFDYLFEFYPIYIWAYFFGLVLASVWFVGKTVNQWSLPAVLSFVFGTAAAVMISILNPATENQGFLYLILCGVVAICSMILPGLSGSFVLILMGNYQLVMIDAVNHLNMGILLPVVIGAGIGLLGFSHFLSWIFARFRDQTIAVLTGFILGSLGVLWPWKNVLTQSFGDKVKPVGYDWYLPEMSTEVIYALAFICAGIVSIWLTERLAQLKSE